MHREMRIEQNGSQFELKKVEYKASSRNLAWKHSSYAYFSATLRDQKKLRKFINNHSSLKMSTFSL